MARLNKEWSQAERDFLDQHVTADTATGRLYWKTESPTGKRPAGSEIKTYLSGPSDAQYLYFPAYNIPGCKRQRNFKVHQVIWYLGTGKQAVLYLDHKNRKKLDNRLCNLREVTPAQNIANSDRCFSHQRVKVGCLKGVQLRTDKNRKPWATIRHQEKSTYLGTHDDPLELAKRYDLASIVLHGDSGCRNFPDSDYTPEQIAEMRDYLQAKRQPTSSGTIH